MTIKNVCVVVVIAFIFYLFVKSSHVGDGCLIGAYLIYTVATVIYVIVNGNLSFEEIKNSNQRNFVSRSLENMCIRRGKIFIAVSMIKFSLSALKNVPSHVVLSGIGYKLIEFDLISLMRFVFACFLFYSPILLAYDIYLLMDMKRKIKSKFGQKTHGEEEE